MRRPDQRYDLTSRKQEITDHLDRSRRAALKGFVVTYVLWQGIVLADKFWRERPGAAADTLFWPALLLGVIWLVFGVRYALVARQIASDVVVARALDDERVRHVRGAAYAVGFWSLGAYLIGARLLAFIVDVPGSLVAQGGIAVALTSAVIGFLVLDRA